MSETKSKLYQAQSYFNDLDLVSGSQGKLAARSSPLIDQIESSNIFTFISDLHSTQGPVSFNL